jgi:hypothetical protein
MPINRPGVRRLNEPERPGRPRVGGKPPMRPQATDKTGLYVGLGVGGVILVVALAFAMSSGGDKPMAKKNSVDPAVWQEISDATALSLSGKLADALSALERTIMNPAYAESKHLNEARKRANEIRQKIDYYAEAEKAIDEFYTRVEESKKAQTAMAQADKFWQESGELLAKYGGTPRINKVKEVRADLERWRGTSDAGVWEKLYSPTQIRINRDFVERGDFSKALQEWEQFASSYGSPELKSKVGTEIASINKLAVAAATSLVQGAGTGAGAKAKLEEAQVRFLNTDGHKIIAQKLKSLN